MTEVCSRQKAIGVKARKDKWKKNAKTLRELIKENHELKIALDKSDDQLTELDLELRESKIQVAEALDALEKGKEIDWNTCVTEYI